MIREEGIQDWVDARVHIGHHLTHNLDHDARVRDLVSVDALQHQDYLQPDDRLVVIVLTSLDHVLAQP
jgi:hypothetical protein